MKLRDFEHIQYKSYGTNLDTSNRFSNVLNLRYSQKMIYLNTSVSTQLKHKFYSQMGVNVMWEKYSFNNNQVLIAVLQVARIKGFVSIVFRPTITKITPPIYHDTNTITLLWCEPSQVRPLSHSHLDITLTVQCTSWSLVADPGTPVFHLTTILTTLPISQCTCCVCMGFRSLNLGCKIINKSHKHVTYALFFPHYEPTPFHPWFPDKSYNRVEYPQYEQHFSERLGSILRGWPIS